MKNPKGECLYDEVKAYRNNLYKKIEREYFDSMLKKNSHHLQNMFAGFLATGKIDVPVFKPLINESIIDNIGLDIPVCWPLTNRVYPNQNKLLSQKPRLNMFSAIKNFFRSSLSKTLDEVRTQRDSMQGDIVWLKNRVALLEDDNQSLIKERNKLNDIVDKYERQLMKERKYKIVMKNETRIIKGFDHSGGYTNFKIYDRDRNIIFESLIIKNFSYEY